MSVSIPGRFNRFAQKFLSLKGGAVITDAGAELMWVYPLFYGAENRYLEGWDRFGVTTSITGAALKFGGLRFRNPPGSNVIAVVEKLQFVFLTADPAGIAFFLGLQSADLTTVGVTTSARFDARGRSQATLIQSTHTDVPALATAQWQGSGAVNTNIDVIQTTFHEIPILPGDALTAVSGTAAIAVRMNFWWRERSLEDSELK